MEEGITIQAERRHFLVRASWSGSDISRKLERHSNRHLIPICRRDGCLCFVAPTFVAATTMVDAARFRASAS